VEDAVSRQELKAQFKKAHRNQDPDGLLDLYYMEGVRKEDQILIRIAARNEVVLPVAKIHFESPGKGDIIDYELEGRRYEATLPVRLKLVVRYATPDSFTASYLLGKKDGRYYLVTSRPVDGPDEKPGG
jgi:hypothetical protein